MVGEHGSLHKQKPWALDEMMKLDANGKRGDYGIYSHLGLSFVGNFGAYIAWWVVVGRYGWWDTMWIEAERLHCLDSHLASKNSQYLNRSFMRWLDLSISSIKLASARKYTLCLSGETSINKFGAKICH